MKRILSRLSGPARRVLTLAASRNFKEQTTILIIDDDESLVKNVYQVLLERKGYRVLTAKSGFLGLEIIGRELRSPDIILVDCSMPDMDGEEFLLELKDKHPKIFSESKVIGLTAYDSRSSAFLRIKQLAFDCREKPFDIDGILQVVSDYLGVSSNEAYPQITRGRRSLGGSS